MSNPVKLAISESKKSTMTSRHGCVAVYNGKVVAKGYNYYDECFLQKYTGKEE